LKRPSRSLSKEEVEIFDNLADWRWRLNNLYYIKDKNGRRILFRPNIAQTKILNGLWFMSIILKARQLGITTLFCILYLDQILFNSNRVAGIVAHKQDDAKRFFSDKVKFAWDNLPQCLKDVLGPPNTDSAGELSFPNGSKIFVSTSVRSGTLQFLHISEFGKICAVYPHKAKEIVTGSINAVHKGNFVTIESTAEGRNGYFFDFCQKAEKAQKEKRSLSPLEFKFFFHPWWEEPSYTDDSPHVSISVELNEYFDKLRDEHGIILTPGQKRWYASKKGSNLEDMFREYPSTPDEAFAVSLEGAYYTKEVSKLYEEKRLTKIPYDSSLPVETWWDLGINDENVILFTQRYGNEIRFIDFYSNHGEGLAHYVGVLKDKGYIYGRHIFPHDVNVKELTSGISRRKTLVDLGLTNIQTIERTKSVNDDIEGVRRLFSRFYFDKEKCGSVVDCLANYRKEWDDRLGAWKDRPRHDANSHVADAMRLLVKGWMDHGMHKNGEASENSYGDFF
jgi:hypothetical protein